MTSARGAWFSAALASLLLASCAPPPRPGELTSFAARFRAESARRATRLAAAEAEMIVRIDGSAMRRLPGFVVSAALAGPDRCRIRATWMLGTAFDLVAERDSLSAWVPSKHALIKIGSLGDSLHRPQPVAFLLTALAASWDPPAAAWREAIAESAVVRLGWRDGADSLTLVVDGATRPGEMRIERDGRVVWVRYSSWSQVGGLDWPTRIEIADADGRFRLRTELQSLRAVKQLNDRWFVLQAPADAELMDWQTVRERLAARGGARP